MKYFVSIFLVLTINITAHGQIRMPGIFRDSMVIQRDKPCAVWGWAKPGQMLRLIFRNKVYETIPGSDGRWKIALQPAPAGNMGNMIIESGTDRIQFKNILAGELWLCSGQSNMEYPLSSYRDFYKEEIAKANYPEIRYMRIQRSVSNVEEDTAELAQPWVAINPVSVTNCSAVGYFFAKKLHERLKVPVGIIISAWGGTPAQSWMDTSAIKSFSNYDSAFREIVKPVDLRYWVGYEKQKAAAYLDSLAQMQDSLRIYRTVDYDDNHWQSFQVPGHWEQKGYADFDGAAQFRLNFNIEPADTGKHAYLFMPAIDDKDSSFINGERVGTMSIWNAPRKYPIPPGLLKPGKNLLSIWVQDSSGTGGLYPKPDEFYILIEHRRIQLSGQAKFKLLLRLQKAKGVDLATMQGKPSVLFNGMIAPVISHTIAGVIWYQGESNARRHQEYRSMFPALINNWRKRFNQPKLPFLFVQLASYEPEDSPEALSEWAYLREAQAQALVLPATGMAVAFDLGERKNIHPKLKKEVGERLAAQAFKKVYNYRKDIFEGPVFQKAVLEKKGLRVYFRNTGGGLTTKGIWPEGFLVAGADKNFFPASATIEGNTVLVYSPDVPKPIYARYAWGNAPLHANLYNAEGFPAAPFRTDK